MKFLTGSKFVQSIEYTSEVILRLLRPRKPQSYRLRGSQITEARYNLFPKMLRSSDDGGV